MRVGAIDIGSNSIRLLVADVRPDGATGTIVTVARAGEPCRLARGMDQTGKVDGEMAERAASLAGDFARRARSLGASHTVVGATAALRRASNGRDVADLISARAGVPVRILSGEEEARLVYEAVVSGLGAGARRSACVVFDLGGGSTEIVSGIGSEVGRWVSLPIGAVNLTERFIRSNQLTPNEMTGLEEDVDRQLMHDCAYMPESAALLAGVGGTVTVLASLDRDLSAYDPALIEGWMIRAPRLEGLVERIAHSSHEEREQWVVLGRGRSDIVVAGALVIRRLARRFRSAGLVCSTHGLRYGLARLAASERTGPADPRAPGGRH
jgi:exopolyphosphatase/guanosine-5'-triphosphate,3'-diphosphate pyrophosphatase